MAWRLAERLRCFPILTTRAEPAIGTRNVRVLAPEELLAAPEHRAAMSSPSRGYHFVWTAPGHALVEARWLGIGARRHIAILVRTQWPGFELLLEVCV